MHIYIHTYIRTYMLIYTYIIMYIHTHMDVTKSLNGMENRITNGMAQFL